MPTQKHEEKRVGEHASMRGEAGGRGEREREREQELWLLFYVFPPPGPALCKLG